METRIVLIDSIRERRREIEDAARLLREGGLVAFPTETVYGLGANLFNPRAVERIFQVKDRPGSMPLALHLSAPKYIQRWTKEVPERAQKLIDHFLPGPLTLILEKALEIPTTVTAGTNKLGIRVPQHPLAALLLSSTKVPVVATSANLSGAPTAVSAKQVLENLNGKIDLILDYPEPPLGIESTVLDLTTPLPRILRSGFISQEEISRVLGEKVLLSSETGFSKSGAEKLNFQEVWLLKGEEEEVKRKLQEIQQRFPKRTKTLLLTEELASQFANLGEVFNLGKKDDLAQIRQNLFPLLFALKEKSGDLLLIQAVKEEGLGIAVMERLNKYTSLVYESGENQNAEKTS